MGAPPPGVWYWPDGVPAELTLDAFVKAFATLGYSPCRNAQAEPGYEKIAIYVKPGIPTHAARQLQNGRWTSKLGDWERIQHDIDALEGNEYGEIAQIMRRPMQKPGSRIIGWFVRLFTHHKAS